MIILSTLVTTLATVVVVLQGAQQPLPQPLPRPEPFEQLQVVMTPEKEELEARYRHVEAVRKEKYKAEKAALRNVEITHNMGGTARRLVF